MSFLGTIISAASSLVSSIGSIASKIGMSLSSGLNIIGNIIRALGIFSGVLKGQEDKSIDDIGERVIQAGEADITREKYPTFEAYQKAVNNFQVDEKKRHSDAERYGTGINYIANGFSELKPELAGMDKLYPLFLAQDKFFTAERMAAYASVAGDMKYALANIKGYFDGTSSFKDAENAKNFMHIAEKTFAPNTYKAEEFDKTLNRVSSNIEAML